MVRRQLHARGIRNPRVLGAFQWVPREAFVPAEFAAAAYHDQPLPVGDGQTISQPYIVARMTELLRPERSDRMLDVGAGTGYQTAILSMLVQEVYAIERLPSLLDGARRRIERLGLTNVYWSVGDGAKGWRTAGPFDGILVAAAAPQVPSALLDQLADGGRLVIPIGDHDVQELIRIERRGDRLIEDTFGGVRFVPLISPDAFGDV